jgi:hypothetical protein
MDIKEFIIPLKVKALVNTNPNFPENANAIEILNTLFSDARSQCIRLSGRAEVDGNTDLVKYLEAKILTYDTIEQSLRNA